ncbi:MAG: FG-GAP-like repeat-containing protein [Balneolaceae bacterium]|nr:FG-GAP-like repeat-containing protein [Balneolaceae bacterium]
MGAEIRLLEGEKAQQKQVASGGDYLSSSAPVVMFAAEEEASYVLEVQWPNGTISRIPDAQPSRMYEIDQEGAEQLGQSKQSPDSGRSPMFQDVSERIDYTHSEQPFDESGLQQLLPVTLSRQGPGVTWMDIDGDGDDDLLISAGKGSSMGTFENMGNGTFEPMDRDMLTQAAPGDQTTIVRMDTEQGLQLLVGSANYEQGNPQVPSAYHYSMSDSGDEQVGTLSNYSTTGPLAAADYDNDGDIDLFLGGRFVPAFYPRNATSRLFKNENGTFVIDQVNSRKLGEMGLVTGAAFSDYDGDGDQDLLISREWDCHSVTAK